MTVRGPKVQVVRSAPPIDEGVSDRWLEYNRPASENRPNLLPSAYCAPIDPATPHDDNVESLMFTAPSIDVVARE